MEDIVSFEELFDSVYSFLAHDATIEPDEINKKIHDMFCQGAEFQKRKFSKEIAQKIDNEFTGSFGEHWRAHYNNPNSGEHFGPNYTFIAKNVGIFTFDIEKK
jgi:hypothetical protein